MKHLVLSLLLIGATLAASAQTATTQEPQKQCIDTTGKGFRCRNVATVKNKCYLHSDNNRCLGQTSKHVRCRHKVKEGQKYCFQHQFS